MIADAIVKAILDAVDLDQTHVDKAKEIIDMVTFTKEDGRDIILVKIGENIEVKIKK